MRFESGVKVSVAIIKAAGRGGQFIVRARHKCFSYAA